MSWVGAFVLVQSDQMFPLRRAITLPFPTLLASWVGIVVLLPSPALLVRVDLDAPDNRLFKGAYFS